MALDHDDDLDCVAFLIANDEVAGIDTLYSDSENEYETPCKRRIPNKPRAFQSAKERFNRFYFNDENVYKEADFERCFRMPRRLFHIIEKELLESSVLYKE